MRAGKLAVAFALVAAPPSPSDRVVTVDIGEPVEYVADFAGSLFIWPAWRPGDPPLVLAVGTMTDDGRGVRTPFLRHEVEAGTRVTIGVTVPAIATPLAPATVDLHLVAAPESDATRAAASAATEEIALVETLRAAGNFDEARRRLQTCIDALLASEGAAHSDLVSEAAWACGFQCQSLALLEDARRAWGTTLAHTTRSFPADHAGLQEVRQGVGVTLRELGDVRTARHLFELILEVHRRTLPEDHLSVQAARGNLAIALKDLGDLQGARELEEAALAVCARTLPEDHPNLLNMRWNLAETLFRLHDLRGARSLQEAVLATSVRTMSEDDRGLQQARANLAITLRALGDPRAAQTLFEQVLAELTRLLPEDHRDLQAARGNLAVTLKQLGEAHAARALEESVLASFTRTLPDDHPNLQLARVNLAGTLAAEQARRGPVDGDEGDGRAAFGAITSAYGRSLARTAQSAWLEGSTREVEERIARSAGDIGRAFSLARGLGAFDPDVEAMRTAFVAAECMRGAAMIASTLRRTAGAHPKYASARAALAEARAEVGRAGQGDAPRDVLDRALARRETAEHALLALAVESGARAVSASGIDVPSLAALLGRDRTAVAYWRYRRSTFDRDGKHASDEVFSAFVLRPDASLACVELGEAKAVEDAVTAWLASAVAGAGGRGLEARAVAQPAESGAGGEPLRRLVWDPLVPLLGDARRIVVVMDDVLHAVPLDALPLEDSVLGDRFVFEHRPSLVDLSWADVRPSASQSLVAVGDVAFGLDGDGRFAPLAATGPEARGVAESFGSGAVVLQGESASCERLAALAPQARFLHLATHGWFAPEPDGSPSAPDVIDARLNIRRQSSTEQIAGASPMLLCGLALAGANLPPDDLGRYPGLVTAEEIAGWDLSNCELAVLSACDTNVGLRRAGQGVASLQKALHMAGARSVITSLWKVGDESTKDLMLDFYRRLWVEKKPKRQALWEAKMRIRDAKDETGAPRYATRDWAAWVLTGDPE